MEPSFFIYLFSKAVTRVLRALISFSNSAFVIVMLFIPRIKTKNKKTRYP
nr:MAG TPA: hypothetical protein [Caudoviricetes sp.]